MTKVIKSVIEEFLKTIDIELNVIISEGEEYGSFITAWGEDCRNPKKNKNIKWDLSEKTIQALLNKEIGWDIYDVEEANGIPKPNIDSPSAQITHMILHECAHAIYYKSFEILPDKYKSLRHDKKWVTIFKELYDKRYNELKNTLDKIIIV